MRVYITFDKGQFHKINGVQYNENCAATIDAISLDDGQRLAKDIFGKEHAEVLPEDMFIRMADGRRLPLNVVPIR